MRGGHKLSIACCLLTAACATNELEIRPRTDAGTAVRQGSPDIAQARGYLALGNAGTALEAFRKIVREQPANAEGYAGIAECYARMGRYDLERTNYELALAHAPHDGRLLSALAASLMRLGETEQAAELRGEVAQLKSADRALAQAEPAQPAALGEPRMATVTVPLPAAKPVQASKAAPAPASPVAKAEPVYVAPVAREVRQSGPFLERLSLGEVALVTTGAPIWKSFQEVALADRQPTMGMTASKQPRIRLLNAARSQGLAAHNRNVLSRAGWAKAEIGDAGRVRQRSIVYYSPGNAALARKLAMLLGCSAVPGKREGIVTVFLGRDAAARRAASRA